jgi:hypothetical protein
MNKQLPGEISLRPWVLEDRSIYYSMAHSSSQILHKMLNYLMELPYYWLIDELRAQI